MVGMSGECALCYARDVVSGGEYVVPNASKLSYSLSQKSIVSIFGICIIPFQDSCGTFLRPIFDHFCVAL